MQGPPSDQRWLSWGHVNLNEGGHLLEFLFGENLFFG